MFTAAESPHQHGLLEQIHSVLRRCIASAWAESDDSVTIEEIVCQVGAARNDLGRHANVSPNMLAFGKEARQMPHFAEHESHLMAESLYQDDDVFRRTLLARNAARQAYIRAEAEHKVQHMAHHRGGATRGPFQIGERVLLYRRVRAKDIRRRAPQLEQTPKRGAWFGPGVV